MAVFAANLLSPFTSGKPQLADPQPLPFSNTLHRKVTSALCYFPIFSFLCILLKCLQLFNKVECDLEEGSKSTDAQMHQRPKAQSFGGRPIEGGAHSFPWLPFLPFTPLRYRPGLSPVPPPGTCSQAPTTPQPYCPHKAT